MHWQLIFLVQVAYDLDRSTTHSKFNLTGVRTQSGRTWGVMSIGYVTPICLLHLLGVYLSTQKYAVYLYSSTYQDLFHPQDTCVITNIDKAPTIIEHCSRSLQVERMAEWIGHWSQDQNIWRLIPNVHPIWSATKTSHFMLSLSIHQQCVQGGPKNATF